VQVLLILNDPLYDTERCRSSHLELSITVVIYIARSGEF
jgi:hypothetical protein